jgi:hypothetical protein
VRWKLDGAGSFVGREIDWLDLAHHENIGQ